MDKRNLGKAQIEAAIGVMVEARRLKLDTPIKWLKDSERDVYRIEARISGQLCHWILVGEAIDDYISDLNVRHSVDFNLSAHFLPR